MKKFRFPFTSTDCEGSLILRLGAKTRTLAVPSHKSVLLMMEVVLMMRMMMRMGNGMMQQVALRFVYLHPDHHHQKNWPRADHSGHQSCLAGHRIGWSRNTSASKPVIYIFISIKYLFLFYVYFVSFLFCLRYSKGVGTHQLQIR